MPTLIQSKPLVIFAGEVKSEGLSWQAFGASVSNFANQWLKIDTGSRVSFAAPLSRGTFAIPGDQVVHLSWEAPSGQPQPAATANQIAYVTVTTERLPDNGGPIGSVPLAAADIFVYYGPLAGLPAFGTVGRFAYTTDTGQFWRDTGTAWVALPIGEGSFSLGFVQLTNNQNAVMARDFLGNVVNMLLLDADPPAGNVLLGPTDPRIGLVVDMFRYRDRHVFVDDFDGSAINTRWTQTITGGGSVAIPGGRSQAELRSGVAAAGDGFELRLGGWNWQRANGERGCWILTMEDALNQEATLGYSSTATPAADFVRFRCTELGAATNWQAECSIGGVVTTVDTGVLRTGQRRYFIIDTLTAAAGTVDFYIDMVLKASINANIPTKGDIQPFLKQISNGAIVNRRSLIDLIEIANNR